MDDLSSCRSAETLCMCNLPAETSAALPHREAATNTEAPSAAAIPAADSRERPVYNTVPVRAVLLTRSVTHLDNPEGQHPALGSPAPQYHTGQGMQHAAACRGAEHVGQQQYPTQQDQGLLQHAAAAAGGGGIAPAQVAALERLRAKMVSSLGRRSAGSFSRSADAQLLEQGTLPGAAQHPTPPYLQHRVPLCACWGIVAPYTRFWF